MIKPFIKADKPTLINLLKLNTPKYFHKDEEQDLINYIDKEIEDYYVLLLNKEILGGGGINYFKEQKLARLSWDFLHPKIHGKGYGKELVNYRLNKIKENSLFSVVEVRTSQHTYVFYQKCGFKLKEIKNNYWAKGYNLYHMEIKLI